MLHVEESLGVPLTATQHEVATELLTSGHRFDLVKGVARSGKTTTLAAVRDGFESAGYTVLGTATSGQAARNLGIGAGSSRGPSPRSPGDWITTPWSSPTATC